jgi:Flp pilus assembly protein TadB
MTSKGRKMEHSFTKPEVETHAHIEMNYILLLLFILAIFVMAWLQVPPIYDIMAVVLLGALVAILVIWRRRRG